MFLLFLSCAEIQRTTFLSYPLFSNLSMILGGLEFTSAFRNVLD